MTCVHYCRETLQTTNNALHFLSRLRVAASRRRAKCRERITEAPSRARQRATVPPTQSAATTPPMQSLSNVGTFAVGATVEAQREDGDDEYEPATVKGFDPKSATLSLLFADGFKAGGVPLSRVKLEQGTVEPPPPAAAPPTTTPADDDAEYDAAVRPTLPTPPTAEEAAVDADAKYRFIAAYKDAGNGLFKAEVRVGDRTYGDAVDALATNCYASHARMLWDYAARGPCAQCYRTPRCARLLGEWARAAALRAGDALQARGRRPRQGVAPPRPGAQRQRRRRRRARRARARAREGAGNRAVREELQEAKKAAAALAKARDSALFGAVDLEAGEGRPARNSVRTFCAQFSEHSFLRSRRGSRPRRSS